MSFRASSAAAELWRPGERLKLAPGFGLSGRRGGWMTGQQGRSGAVTRAARGLVVLTAGLTCMALLAPVAAASPIGDADNAMTAAWKDAGGDTSDLGAKQGEAYAAGAGFAQDFVHGKMFFTPATGPRLMMGAILDKYESLGGPAASDLGFP